MFKKIILIWMLMFSSLFSSGDDFITTLPRKEKAYLDIEVTKIKTEVRDIIEIDRLNKTIKLRDISLDTSQSLILTENPDVFGALFSVNGRIGALRNIAKETNLSYFSDESNNEVTIKYNELPSNIYAGVWNKNGRNLEKMYSLNLHTPSTFAKLLDITMYPSVSVPNLDIGKNLDITIGKINTRDSGWTTKITFEYSNEVTFKTLKGNEVKGILFFKQPKSQPSTPSLSDNIQKLNDTEIIVSFTSDELQKIQEDGAPFKISFEKNGTHITATNKGGDAAERELIFEDFDIYFNEFFDIDYLPPGSVIYLNGPFIENQDVYTKIGYLDIRNAINKYEMHLSPSDVRMKVNEVELANRGANLLKNLQGNFADRFIVDRGQSGRTDIFLKVPYSAIKSALDKNSSIHTMNSVGLNNTPKDNPHTLGTYEIIVSDPEKPVSSPLILEGSAIQSDGTILLNHGALTKDTSSDSVVSTGLTLKRENSNDYLTRDKDNISIYFDNDGFVNLKNAQKSLETFLKISNLNLSSDQKFCTFDIVSLIRSADINNSDTGDYSGTTTLNIIIDN